MFYRKPTIEYGIIGLGRFGYSLASTLAQANKEILVLDSNESKIRQIRQLTDNAFIINDLSKETLAETGIQNCGTVIICIGEQIDISILTTLTVIDMGVPRVIAKAISPEQGKVLEKIGAEVVYPEHDMAVRLANRLISSRALEYIELSDNVTITELKLSAKISGQSVYESGIRKKFKLNIIALEHEGRTTTDITPDLLLAENDVIVVVGSPDNIRKFESYLGSGR